TRSKLGTAMRGYMRNLKSCCDGYDLIIGWSRWQHRWRRGRLAPRPNWRWCQTLQENEVVGVQLKRVDIIQVQLVGGGKRYHRVDADVGRAGQDIGKRGASRCLQDDRDVAARPRDEIRDGVHPGAEPGQPADIDKILRVGDQIVGVDEVVAGVAVDVIR